MQEDLILRCTNCGKTYQFDLNLKYCEKCGAGLSVEIKNKKIMFNENKQGIWKHESILPRVEESYRITLGEGNTPLHKSIRISKELKLENLWFKDETIEPTGSYLDRSSAFFVSFITSRGYRSITTYSTGNLGASMAAYSARANISIQAYVRQTIDLGKLFQMVAYGAKVKLLKNSKEIEEKEALVVAEYDPLINEAKKTIMNEIFFQLNEKLPDYIIAPMGEGGLLYSIYKMLNEIKESNKVKDIKTKLIGVQPEGCAPIAKAYLENLSAIKPEESPRTRVSDLNVPSPKFGNAALKAIRETKGMAVVVNENELANATSLLAEKEGILAEPAASLTIAALMKLLKQEEIEKDSSVVCIITGSGLKDPKIMKEIALKKSNLGPFIEELSGAKILGDTKMKILKILSEKDSHGYQIWKELREKYNVRLTIPTVYQHLSELIKEGYVAKSGTKIISGRRREYYTITEKGRILV